MDCIAPQHHWRVDIWLVVGTPTSLKNDGVKVSWDDDIPNWMGKIIQMFQTTNQCIIFRQVVILEYTPTTKPVKVRWHSMKSPCWPVKSIYFWPGFPSGISPGNRESPGDDLSHIIRYPLVNIQKTMENHHFQWVNPLFLWPFSIAASAITRG